MISRSLLLRGGGSAIAIALAGLPLPASAQAAAGALTGADLLKKLGGSIANGVVSGLAHYAFGQILSAAGVDMSGLKEIQDTLNQIQNSINQLSRDIASLKDVLQKELAELRYDVAYQQVAALIATNKELLLQSATLVSMPPGDLRDAQKNKMNRMIERNLLTGPHIWQDALSGAGGQSGLIAAWGRAVFRTYSVYGPVQAAAAQKNYDFFDAQQAITVAFIIDYWKEQGNLARANQTRRDWYAARDGQRGLYRGGDRQYDEMPVVDDNGRFSSDIAKTAANSFIPSALPARTLFSKTNGLMWLLYGSPIVLGASGPSWSDFDAQISRVITEQNNSTKSNIKGIKIKWDLPPSPQQQIGQLITDCGGQIAKFRDALYNQGFFRFSPYVGAFETDMPAGEPEREMYLLNRRPYREPGPVRISEVYAEGFEYPSIRMYSGEWQVYGDLNSCMPRRVYSRKSILLRVPAVRRATRSILVRLTGRTARNSHGPPPCAMAERRGCWHDSWFWWR